MSNALKLRVFNRDPKISSPQKPQLSADNGTEIQAQSRIMEGYATLFDTKTDLYWYTLSIDKGAYKESLARGDDVVSLFNHDWNYVLGRMPDTLRIDDSHEFGLWQETDLPNHDLGQRILEDINRKALTQMSVSFFIEEYVYTEGATKEELGNFHVTKARLEDVSAVTFGQYPQTTLGIKQLHAAKPSNDFFEQLLAQSKTGKEIEQSLTRAREIQILLNEQRKRKLRGLLGS